MDKSVQDYIDSAADERRELFLSLQAKLMEIFPDLSTKLSYGVVKYYNASGYIFLGYWKEGVSLYPGRSGALDEFRTRNPRIKTSTGTIKLKLGTEIPWEDIVKVMQSSFA